MKVIEKLNSCNSPSDCFVTVHFQSSFSAKRVYSSSGAWNGRYLPGSIWHGEDSSVCDLHAPAARARGWPRQCARHMPHQVAFPRSCLVANIDLFYLERMNEEVLQWND